MSGDPPGQAVATGSDRVRVFGHDHVTAELLGGLGAGQLVQAWLIEGAPAVGKRTVARFLAQAVLCRGEGDRPCGHCRACRMVHQGTFADLHVVPPPLRVESVRALQHVLALAPTEGRHRVAILADIEAASLGAANSLLKTLEEPPAHAVLVLTTSAASAVPATVRSRCRSLHLRPLPGSVVAEALAVGWGVAPDRAAFLAGLSAGRLGWAVRAVGDDAVLAHRGVWLDALDEMLGTDRAARLARASRLADPPEALPEALATWQGWWRDVLLLQHGLEGSIVNRDRLAALHAAAARYAVAQAVAALRGIDDALAHLAASANARLALDVLVLGLP